MITLDTIVKDIGRAPLRRGPRLGIELELENFNKYGLKEDPTSWYMERDPSLRVGGMELISRILQPGAVPKALEQASIIIQEADAEAHERCGVHIHVNLSDFTLRRLWNFLTLYVLVEPSLFKQYADGRQGNHFCVPLYCNAVFAQGMYDDIRTIRRGSPAPRDLGLDLLGRRRRPELNILNCIKYSALNLKPLSTLGTAEFRLFPGTTNMDKVLDWSRFVLKLRKIARQMNDPLDVLEEYESKGLDTLRERLGLEDVEVDPIDQEEAEDVATMAAGHIPKQWQELEWEIT